MAPGKHTRFFSSNPEKQPLLPKHGSKLVLPEQMAKPYEWRYDDILSYRHLTNTNTVILERRLRR
jgi:hypothetical protein